MATQAESGHLVTGSTPFLLELRLHRARDHRESESLARMLREIPHLPDPFDRDVTSTHVTASSIVLGPGDDVLLHRHKRLGTWLQPGGHVDHGETPADAAVREVREETGLRVLHFTNEPEILHVDVHPGPGGHTHFDVRYLLLPERSLSGRPDPGESPEVRWFTRDEATAAADESLASALSAAWDRRSRGQ